MMSHEEALREFKIGLDFLRGQYSRKALAHLGKAAELDENNPFYLSYFGLALAAAERKWSEAEKLCLSALKMKRTQPELYLNLAEVYNLAGRKEEAIDTLNAGLPVTKHDERLARALRRLGLRKPAVISFLPRDNVINRELGKMRQRILKSLGREA